MTKNLKLMLKEDWLEYNLSNIYFRMRLHTKFKITNRIILVVKNNICKQKNGFL